MLAGAPLEWFEVELRADPAFLSRGQFHSPTPPISEMPLALFHFECSGHLQK